MKYYGERPRTKGGAVVLCLLETYFVLVAGFFLWQPLWLLLPIPWVYLFITLWHLSAKGAPWR
jgi:hypothetical protein